MAALDTSVAKDGVDQETVEAVAALSGKYKYGWNTEIEMEYAPKGVNPDIVHLISAKNEEPEWMTEWRLKAFKVWKAMEEPDWANVKYQKPDFQAIAYYSAPTSVDPNKTLDDVDPDLLAMYKKLGISIDEQKKMNNIAMDIVVDSVSVATTFKETLSEKGIIFMSISEAIKEHPELVKKYIGTWYCLRPLHGWKALCFEAI